LSVTLFDYQIIGRFSFFIFLSFDMHFYPIIESMKTTIRLIMILFGTAFPQFSIRHDVNQKLEASA